MTPCHKAALTYAKGGVPVFPCVPGGKTPAVAGGFKGATVDTGQIDAWWTENPGYNLAIVPEDAGWCVIDLDGEEGIGAWEALGGTFDTRTVLTPNGGLHLYFSGSLPPSVRKLGPGVDVRGQRSYVLVPPSEVDGREYSAPATGFPQASLPSWVSEALAGAERTHLEADAELDGAENIARAKSRLKELVERDDVAIEGAGGNERTYRLAAEIINLGLSAEKAAEAIEDHWNPYCSPPWTADELETIVGNAWKYKQNAAGSWGALDNPWAGYTPEPETPKPPTEWPPIYTAAALSGMHFEPPRFVWADRLLADEPNLYTGDAGVGKTTLAENLAVAVAAGIPLLGHDTIKMPVLLLVAEDSYGPVRDNLLAIRQALDAPEETLADIHVLSVKSAKIPGGHRLATITDDGKVDDTDFMREYVAPYLAGLAGGNHPSDLTNQAIEVAGRAKGNHPGVLWVIDPLSEYVAFDRYKDEPCRALATTWLRSVCEIGRVTPLVLDHPSKASMASGAHYAGSTQLKAAFSLFATLKGGAWSGGTIRHRDLTFEVLKGRYAGEGETKFLRSSRSPAYILPNSADHIPDDIQTRVYTHILGRLELDELTTKDNRGSLHGPSEVSYALAIDEAAVKAAMAALTRREWLRWEKGGFALGARAPTQDQLEDF